MATQGFESFNWQTTELNYTFHLNGQTLLIVVIFISVLLIITLLYIYIHFMFHHGLVSGVTASNVSSTPHAVVPAAWSPGIDAAAINRLPIFVHRSSAANSDVSNSVVVEFTECSICLDMFRDEEIVKVLPVCQHAYHSVCVDRWLSTHSTCPLCRASPHVHSSISDQPSNL
ncbi:RING-H2 finger protein ATL66-like [Cornus florida]|uniref:RING-H2 finger protein ATL66-like n=1 Tax=Cornus florida TaxID=4283 RepID=UPI0028986C03|nr:RING-H2 finger protein ATL66-like [Cornus florida]